MKIKYLSRNYLFLVPLLFFIYVILMNTIPFGGYQIYSADLGSFNDIFHDLKLTSPLSRISNRIFNNSSNINYREINSSLVYLDLTSSLLSRSSKIDLEVKFKDNFPENQKFILGARDKQEWSYYWKPVYIPFYQSLEPLSSVRTFEINQPSEIEIILLQIPEGSTIATYSQINNTLSPAAYEPGNEYISATLRGTHTFYTHAKDTINIAVSKQDMNWYNGTDELKIKISGNSLAREFIIPDDGNNITGDKGFIQTQSFSVENLTEGIYRIDMENDADLTINSISINQKKLVAEGRIFLIDPTTIYFELPRKQTLYFQTYHQSAAQNLTIAGTAARSVEIAERATTYNITLSAGNYTITSPKGDVIIEGPTYFSFDKESYFRPFKYEIVPLKYDLDWIKNNVDYVIIPDLNVTDLGDGWKIGRASWEAKDLYIKDKTLSFCINIPHLSKEEYKNYTIPIDWIKVTVTKPSIFEGIFGGLK